MIRCQTSCINLGEFALLDALFSILEGTGASISFPVAASMNLRKDAQQRLWIRSRDSLGNAIDQSLIEAAYRIWERARFVVIRYLAEDTEAADILESVVDSASRVRNGSGSIQYLDTYLLKSVARESIRRRRKNGRIEFIDPGDLDRLAGAIASDWDRQIDQEKWMVLLRASLDAKGREILDYRLLEYDWRYIAGAMGYSSGHSAEVQFQKKLDKALERIQAHHGSSWKAPQGRNSDE
jgi:hypothetical protein